MRRTQTVSQQWNLHQRWTWHVPMSLLIVERLLWHPVRISANMSQSTVFVKNRILYSDPRWKPCVFIEHRERPYARYFKSEKSHWLADSVVFLGEPIMRNKIHESEYTTHRLNESNRKVGHLIAHCVGSFFMQCAWRIQDELYTADSVSRSINRWFPHSNGSWPWSFNSRHNLLFFECVFLHFATYEPNWVFVFHNPSSNTQHEARIITLTA